MLGDRVLVPWCVIRVSSRAICLGIVPRVSTALLVSGQGIWPRIAGRALHPQFASLAIRRDILPGTADPGIDSLAARGAKAGVVDGVLKGGSMEVEVVGDS